MKKTNIIKGLLASVLALCMAAGAAGCGNDSKSKTEETTNTHDDSMVINTVSIVTVPYDSSLIDNEWFAKADSMKIITFTAESPHFNDEKMIIYGIKPKKAFPIDTTHYYSYFYASLKDGDNAEKKAMFAKIVCPADYDPSDFVFYYNYDKENFDCTVPDKVNAIPEGLLTAGPVYVSDAFKLDGEYCYRYSDGESIFYTTDDLKEERYEEVISFTNINGVDGSLFDAGKFTFVPSADIANDPSLSKITVTFAEEPVDYTNDHTRIARQDIRVRYSYEVNDKMSEAELKALSDLRQKMLTTGTYLYDGKLTITPTYYEKA